ncbi:MAG: tRNA (guanosine(37)-N1)-methyltransferase TrmD [bacterium]|nr:tRNA (guanosine(37)-N1)-methyltransferase TrmD [bacterium]
MIQFDIITIFPDIFAGFLKESIIKRAQNKKLLKIKIHNLRDFTKDKRRKIDDKPFGGGRGMVIMVEPIYKAIKKIKNKGKKSRIILLSPRGKKFNQKSAYNLTKFSQIIIICGRYEGIDERVLKFVDEVISIGDFVLMGGEIPAMAIIESVSRLIPKIVGKSENLIGERLLKKEGTFTEYPQYTRPPKFYSKGKFRRARPMILSVPKVLLSGNHKKIEEWRKEKQKLIK